MNTAYEDVVKQLAEDNKKRLEEAQKKVEAQKQAERDRAQEMRDLDQQLVEQSKKRELEANKPKSDDKLDQAILLLTQLLAERKADKKGEHGNIDNPI